MLVPSAGDALAARMIESLGFEAVYLSGAGVTNHFYALSDRGSSIAVGTVNRTAVVRDAVSLH